MRRLDMLLKGQVTLDTLTPHVMVFTHFMYHLDRMQDIWEFQPCHTVVPMRDPLASLLTFSGYNTDQQKESLRIARRMEEFLRALQLQEHRPVVYVPVDLERTKQERIENLRAASNGIVEEEKILEWAEEWPVHNTRGEYGPKLWYKERDLEKVKAHLHVDGRWQQLEQYGDKVRPYLEQIGYKDLMWYD